MTRAHSLAIAAATLAAGSLLLASAAYATVTNPANNPHRIEVLGDDGNSYVDGQDTLPGYDDLACTFIPGAWFDFDNNKVHYADGQSIPWTEWDRIAGYSTWLDEKNAAAAAAAATTTTTTTSSGSTTSGSTSKPASGGTTASQTTAASSDGSSIAPTASPDVRATPSPSPSSTPEVSEAAIADDEDLAAGASTTSAQGASSSVQSGAGRGILIALFALGVIAYGAYEIVRRRSPKGIAA